MKNRKLLFTIMMTLLMSVSAMAQDTIVRMGTTAQAVKLHLFWEGDGTITANGTTPIINGSTTENIPVVDNSVNIVATGNVTLKGFGCKENLLSNLNVSACTDLDYLYCNNNNLTELDVSACTKLKTLTCNDNILSNLNVSTCTKLEYLEFANNQITGINLPTTTTLNNLGCQNNQLTNLDVSGYTNLKILNCGMNQLSSLNLSGLKELTIISCFDNQLTNLNLSGCQKLLWIDAGYQVITLPQATTSGSNLAIENPVMFNNAKVTNITGAAVNGNNISWTGLFGSSGSATYSFDAQLPNGLQPSSGFTGTVTQPWVYSAPQIVPEAVGFEFVYNGINYKVTSDNIASPTVEVALNPSASGNITIPEIAEYNGISYAITAIGDNAFGHCNNITTVTLPTGITTIGRLAFAYSGLSGIILSNELTTIGDGAFSTTNITSIDIPGNVAHIGTGVFYQCRSLPAINVSSGNNYYCSDAGVLLNKNKTILMECPNNKTGHYTIPNTVITISGGAFDGGSSIGSITIPSSVQNIGNWAFANCWELTSIEVNSSNTNFSSESGILFNKNKTTIMLYPQNKAGIEYTIPSTVSTIAQSAISNKYLESITIPVSVVSIEWQGISRQIIKEIYSLNTTPPQLSDEDVNVNFSTCILYVPANSVNAYKSANIWGKFNNILAIGGAPGNPEAVGFEFVYNGINYKVTSDNIASPTVEVALNPNTSGNIVIPAIAEYNGVSYAVTAIAERAFDESCDNLTSISIPASVSIIGRFAFGNFYLLHTITVDVNNANYCDVNGVLFSKDKKTIIKYPMGKTETGYSIPNTVEHIEDCAFFSCQNLTSVNMPNGIKNIGNESFRYCSFTTINIPNTVISIGTFAFNNCPNLTSVYIPSSVTNISYGAFSSCKLLQSITVDTNNTNFCDIDSVLFSKDKKTIMQYPAGKPGVSYSIPNTVEIIDFYAFYYCHSLSSIDIPSNVTFIGFFSFIMCENLTEVTCHVQQPIDISVFGDNVFPNPNIANCTLYVPANSVNAYKAAPIWKNFKEILAIGGEEPEDPETGETIVSMTTTTSTLNIFFISWEGDGTVHANDMLITNNNPNNNIPVVNGKVILKATGNVKLKTFDCIDILTSLDVSKCTELIAILIRGHISSLDLSECKKLEYFDCQNNDNLTSLDLSHCTKLISLNCSYNSKLASLNISTCKDLTVLECSNNILTNLDVSGMTKLTRLHCNGNKLSGLDVSTCTELEDLICYYNSLTSLNISGCSKLTSLWCHFNNLTTLNTSTCTELEELECNNNQLAMLNLPASTKLKRINCDNNQLTNINVAQCTNLLELNCMSNKLSDLNISALTNLTKLNCDINNLTVLDVSKCTKLTWLTCYMNQLSQLDVSMCTNLTNLGFSDNNLSSIDVSKCTKLEYLSCSGNNLSTIDVSMCPDLLQLTLDNNNFSSLHMPSLTKLDLLTCQQNQIIDLDISACTNLTYLYANDQRITLPQEITTNNSLTITNPIKFNGEAISNIIGDKVTYDGKINWTELSGTNGNASFTFEGTLPYDLRGRALSGIVTQPWILSINPDLNQFVINISSNDNTYGTVSGGGTLYEGSSVTIVATANDGYRFVNWTEAGVEVYTDTIYTFVVNKNRTLVANFVPVTVTAEEPEPVNEDNKGSIDFSLSIPVGSTITGTFEIRLPEGYVLDESATRLIEALAGHFDLVITFKGNNLWQIEIKSNGLRSSSQAVLTKIMDIVYTVDPEVKDGTYQIDITNVDMLLNDGTTIEENKISVTTEVARNATGLSPVEYNRILAFARDGNLIVRCNPSTKISVYSISGVKVRQIVAQSDETTIAIPKGFYVVRVGTKTIKIINN